MGWFDWLWNMLGWLGLANKSGKLLLLGLDNAGKTTLLHMLHDDRIATHAPTQRATKQTLQIGGITFECFDLGGHAEARSIWQDYYVDASAIVYMVDAYDRERLGESRHELNSLLMAPSLRHVPILVIGNKIDLPGAVSEPELRHALCLSEMVTTGKKGQPLTPGVRPCEVFMASVIQRAGFDVGFRWLAEYIK